MTDPLADMLTRIRNALLRGKPTVITPASKLRENVLSVLEDEGYIRGFMKLEIEGEFPMFEIELKYHEGDPVIKKLAPITNNTAKTIPNFSFTLNITYLLLFFSLLSLLLFYLMHYN